MKYIIANQIASFSTILAHTIYFNLEKYPHRIIELRVLFNYTHLIKGAIKNNFSDKNKSFFKIF